jgi:hypothetical protein
MFPPIRALIPARIIPNSAVSSARHHHLSLTHRHYTQITATMAPPPVSKKRKLAGPAAEKIEFDFSAREEYLTGFHKRKVARMKHAQEENAKKEKEEKLRFRREVR